MSKAPIHRDTACGEPRLTVLRLIPCNSLVTSILAVGVSVEYRMQSLSPRRPVGLASFFEFPDCSVDEACLASRRAGFRVFASRPFLYLTTPRFVDATSGTSRSNSRSDFCADSFAVGSLNIRKRMREVRAQ